MEDIFAAIVNAGLNHVEFWIRSAESFRAAGDATVVCAVITDCYACSDLGSESLFVQSGCCKTFGGIHPRDG
jgi:hypothetical protein